MRVDCYNSLYESVGNLEAGDTFWHEDTLYMKCCDEDEVSSTAVRLDTGRLTDFSYDCMVIKALTKVVSE